MSKNQTSYSEHPKKPFRNTSIHTPHITSQNQSQFSTYYTKDETSLPLIGHTKINDVSQITQIMDSQILYSMNKSLKSSSIGLEINNTSIALQGQTNNNISDDVRRPILNNKNKAYVTKLSEQQKINLEKYIRLNVASKRFDARENLIRVLDHRNKLISDEKSARNVHNYGKGFS
jgi:hypothetical protein